MHESNQPSAVWEAPSGFTELNATVHLPGSKSLSNRMLVLAALAAGVSNISGLLNSRDTQLMLQALQQLGVDVKSQPAENPHNLDVQITPPRVLQGPATIDCGLAGTVMRFLPALAPLATGEISFDGDAYARKRPMAPLLTALTQLGARFYPENPTALPFTITGSGSFNGGCVELDAAASSQFVSALLLAGARYKQGITIKHTGNRLPSLPHIEMTLEVLRANGVVCKQVDSASWQVLPGTITPLNCSVEPDLSNAAPFLAAALVAGGSVTVPNWPAVTTQVGAQLRQLLAAFGARVSYANCALTVTGNGTIKGADLHIPEAGELAPTLIGLAALADTPSRITGIGHIRHHETDRIAALVTEINRLGGQATELNDGIAITPAKLQPGLWHSYADHRMATTGALLGLRVPRIQVHDVACTAKTLPDFAQLWTQMLASTGA